MTEPKGWRVRRSTGRRPREIHNQVRAWHLAFQDGPVQGPIAQLDGEHVKLKRTSLTDPSDGSPAHETGDGQIWILETEPSGRSH